MNISLEKYIRFYFIIAFILLLNIVNAQAYVLTDQGSTLQFSIKNFGLKTKGHFTGIKGSLVFDINDLTKSSVTISVNAATINTNNSTRDKHLRKEDYFNVDKYPNIGFMSTKFTKGKSADDFSIYGNLTIKGVTKNIHFDMKKMTNANGHLFSGEFEMNRRDFDVGGSSISLSDIALIKFNISTKN